MSSGENEQYILAPLDKIPGYNPGPNFAASICCEFVYNNCTISPQEYSQQIEAMELEPYKKLTQLVVRKLTCRQR